MEICSGLCNECSGFWRSDCFSELIVVYLITCL